MEAFHTLIAGNGASGGHFLPRLRAATPIIACNRERIARFGVVVKREALTFLRQIVTICCGIELLRYGRRFGYALRKGVTVCLSR